MVSVSRNFCPWLCFLLYMPSMDNLIYFYHFLYQVRIACHFFSPSVLKTQKMADSIYLFDFPESQILSDWNWTHLPPTTRALFFALLSISVNGTNVLQDVYNRVWGSSVEWPSLTHYNQSLPMSWLFYQLKSSPQFSLYISVISV